MKMFSSPTPRSKWFRKIDLVVAIIVEEDIWSDNDVWTIIDVKVFFILKRVYFLGQSCRMFNRYQAPKYLKRKLYIIELCSLYKKKVGEIIFYNPFDMPVRNVSKQ